MRFVPPLAVLLFLAGCVSAPSGPRTPAPPTVSRPTVVTPPPVTRPPPPPVAGFQVPRVMRMRGLEGVIEQDADNLIRQFGVPRLDVREGDMRKLQFAGEACVLDIFLYPLRPADDPVATYLDARRSSDGQDVDRVRCVEALRRSQ